jgi:SAM-dependent methyltransferase
MLEFLETNLGKTGINRILDFGCGTGIHLNSLSDEKVELYGYDRNEYMLDVARQNYPNLFVASDYAKIPGELDLVYSLFDVVNYQVSDKEVEVFFRSLASKLARGATLVVDGWHYAGVAQDPPEMRERNILFESSTITRRVTPTTSNNYRTTVLHITLEDKARSEILTNESHIMRAFDAAELEKFATSCGFTGVSFRDGGDWDKDLMSNSWRFVMFAEKA